AGLTTSSSWCTTGLGTPDYRMAHTIEHRLSAKTKFLAPGGGTLPLREGHFVRNLTIDKATGLPKRSVDPAGLITDYSYDALGRLTAEKPTSGAWVEYEYKKPTSSQLARINVRRRAQGQTTGTALTSQASWYDSFGRVWHERDELPGGVTSKQVSSYYPNGWLRWKSVAHSGTTSGVKKTFHQDYDPFGRPAEIVPPDGAAHAIDFEYRGIRQVKRTVSVATGTVGQETPSSTIERSDAYGRLIEVEEPSAPGGANVSTHYSYDAANRLTRVHTTAQGVSQARLFDYDGRGFLTREKHPELGTFGNGSLEFSDYDALGNAGRRRIGSAGGASSGAFDLLQDYDAQGRLTRIKERRYQGGIQRPIKEFTYGTGAWAGNRSLGKVETAIRHNWIAPPWNPSAGEVDVSVQEVYTFGGVAGRPSQRRTTLSSLQTFHQSWIYDDLGNVTSRTYPQCLHSPCAGTTTNRTVPNSYTRGRLTAVPGYAPSITYHDHGMLDTVAHVNGTSTYHRKDAFGIRRPGSIGASGVVGLTESTPLQQSQGLVYQYDGAGNVKFLGDEVYQYDAVSRVVKGTMGGGNSQSYSYDAFGNISAVSTVRSGISTTRGYGIVRSTNRLSATGYDAAGNQLHFGSGTTGYTYTWDALSKLRSKQSGNGAIEDYYLYTADDERINTLHWAESPIEETWTLRDLGGQVLRTWGTVGGSAGTWNHREDHIHRDGQLLASWRPAEGLRFFHLDHLGTPRLITKADGRSAGLHTYFPFGEESVPNGSSERMKFTGHERDTHGTAGQGDDLDYMHARYCNPLNGRFLSVDPARESGKPGAPQSWNRYAYGRGNPVKFVDPDGRETSVALALERDIEALHNGEITTEQYHLNVKRRAQGGALGVVGALGGLTTARVAGAVGGKVLIQRAKGALARAFSRAKSRLGGAKSPKSTRGLQRQLESHKKKLADFKRNPDKFDNKGFLRKASPERRKKIIEGRIKSLERQIENFEMQIKNQAGGSL
ncbi:MAG: RHS repeat-associated core domain-containing protein, partial [Acidobacteriota bacterium]